MNSPFRMVAEAQSAIVYVRPVMVADLPEDLREQIGDIETVYSVHRPDGERLALVRDRSMAFSLARQHDLAPVSAH
ncbi:MAG: DUF1150 family protein [Pseudotabrizicola sp.]|uniref:DUF1150 family protein n=1 Tax=Pseudotabrizicola sp. TaxID=2939647 RepID=UPI002715A124|nr:DUF1150 family protein [Pseudotabrizicola sp.]MDO9640278.1 DUF1150 family protein [Pseudotabrizicola sp.]